MPIFKRVNKDFFKTWSGPMAYTLGFFAADGTMIMNRRGAHFIEFHITDKEILFKIRKKLSSNHKISVRDRKHPGWKLGYRLQIGSKDIYSDLSAYGFTPNKSKIIKFLIVPKDFLGDFVRGYFDGDGNIYFRKHKVKDRKNKRWIFSTRFTSGSLRFLKGLHKRLGRFVDGGRIYKKTRGYDLVFSHRDSLALYRLMYNTKCRGLYLKRKYKLFSKAVNTLYGVRLRV